MSRNDFPGLTAEKLAEFLAEEFESSFWGDIEPRLFRLRALEDTYESDIQNAKGL